MLHEQISDKLSCDAKTILTLDANLTNEALFSRRYTRVVQAHGPPYMDFIDERTACVSKPKQKPTLVTQQKHLDKCGPFGALTKNNESRKKC